ncbi:ubiquitin-protein ligase peroxin 12 [Coemansia sp. Benny D115]|nr:ubiquitin-protein ligase peroxin 12 [Coemansia sp. Benny D115]
MEFMSDMLSGADAGKPSVFELVAQQKMTDLLEPALRHITSFYAHRYPRYLVRLLNWHEEAYAAVMLLVEKYYLRNYGGSFTEHFYGLKRTRQAKIRGSDGLTRGDQWRSLIVLVVVPVLKSRLDQWYERISGGEAARLLGSAFRQQEEQGQGQEQRQGQPVEAWARRWMRKVYPLATFAGHMAQALYQLAYMFDRTSYSSPWLHLLGLRLRRLSAADYRAMDARPATTGLGAPSNGSWLRATRNLVARLLGGGLGMLRVALPLAIFFYRFLEWWYRSDLHKRVEQQPLPPPPSPIKPHADGVPLPEDQSLCPLCLKQRTNPAMAASGYVFCYPCIHRHVDAEGTCPVTLIKTTPADIRKLYADA